MLATVSKTLSLKHCVEQSTQVRDSRIELLGRPTMAGRRPSLSAMMPETCGTEWVSRYLQKSLEVNNHWTEEASNKHGRCVEAGRRGIETKVVRIRRQNVESIAALRSAVESYVKMDPV